jgi:plastocyanin
MMGTVIMKRRIIQNAQSINEEVFIIGIFVVLLASLIVFPISNIASVFAVGETQQLRQSEKLLPDTSIQTSRSATQANMTNSSTNTVLPRTPALNTSSKVLIAGDESDKPYMPGSITIKTGDKVGWINTDEEVHTVTSGFENNTDKGKQFDSGLLNNNQTFEHTFDKAGTYNYFCTVHPTMTGVVNVK